MLFKNNSDSIIPLGSKVCPAKGTVELTEAELQDPAIAPYIGRTNLVQIDVAPPVKEVPKKEALKVETVEEPTSGTVETDVTGDKVGAVVVPPKPKTDKELEEEKDKESVDETVGVAVNKTLEDGTTIRGREEIPKRKLNAFIKKLKGITSWKKKIELAETEENIALLELTAVEFREGTKIKEALDERVKKLKRKAKRGK